MAQCLVPTSPLHSTARISDARPVLRSDLGLPYCLLYIAVANQDFGTPRFKCISNGSGLSKSHDSSIAQSKLPRNWITLPEGS